MESAKAPLRRDYLPGNRSRRLTWRPGGWIHVRTEDGREGWMHITDLVGWAPEQRLGPGLSCGTFEARAVNGAIGETGTAVG